MTEVSAELDRVAAAVDALFTVLDALEVAQCDLEELATVSSIERRLAARAACLAADRATRRRELAQVVGDRPVDNTIDPNHQRTQAEEQADIARAEVFDQFPGIDDVTRGGELPASYADAIARAVKCLNDTQLAEFRRRHQKLDRLAASMSLHAFRLHLTSLVNKLLSDFGVDHTARHKRNRKVRKWTDIETGMGHLHVELDPETFARVTDQIIKRADSLYHAGRDDANDTRTREQLEADAFAELVLDGPAGDGDTLRPGTNLLVLVDLDTLRDGLHDCSICTTSNGVDLPVSEIRRLACEANIIPLVMDGEGRALDAGRTKRLATEDQRIALRAMYDTCAIDGCSVPFEQCEIHHLKPWEPPFDGGTDLNNLRPLCTSGPNHHAQWHRHGWAGYIDPSDGALVINYPDGTTERHLLPRTCRAPVRS